MTVSFTEYPTIVSSAATVVHANDELVRTGRAEILHRDVLRRDGLEGLADLDDGHGLVELDVDQRAAGEIDAVVHAAHHHGEETEHDDDERGGHRVEAVTDEIEVGARLDQFEHRESFSGARC
jgi:hypothetical protein